MQKNQSYIKHFLTVGSGTLVNMAIGFLTTPIITRLVGTEEYGQYSIFTMYASIALMVLCMGLDQALIRYYYKYDEIDYKKTLLRECWIPSVITCVCVSCIVISLSVFHVVTFEFDQTILITLCICVIFQVINRIDLVLLRVSYQTKMFTSLQILYKLVFTIFVIIGCKTIGHSYFLIMAIATMFAYAFASAIGIWTQKNLWKFWTIRHKYVIDRKELYMYAFPFVISMGITTLFQAIDKISLNRYCSYSEVGVYASAMSLVHIFAVVQTTFNSLWVPMATERYEKEPENKQFHITGNRVITLIMFAVGVTLIFAKDLLALLLGSDFREAAFILPFLTFTPMMLTISETTVVGIVFKKKSHLHIVIATIACVVNFIGNTLLVPRMGGRGAAISTGISYIVFFAVRTVLSNRYFPIDWPMVPFSIITVVSVIYAAYCTFHSFDVITCICYVAIIALLVVMYRDILKLGIQMGRKFISTRS